MDAELKASLAERQENPHPIGGFSSFGSTVIIQCTKAEAIDLCQQKQIAGIWVETGKNAGSIIGKTAW